MAENIMERLNRIGAEKKIADFRVKQKQDYEFKKRYAYIRAWEFYNEAAKRDLNVHVSVGGLDSITLFMFLRSIGINAPGVSVSILEDVSIQRVHKQLGIERLKSAVRYVDENGTEHRWKKPEILQEFGFPVLSKEIAGKIETLQHPTEKNKTVRHAIITGETGEFACCIMYQMVAREIKKRLLTLSVKECVQVYQICVCRLQKENFTHFILN